MGRSCRKYKRSRPKVRVGLPRKKPNVFKPAFTVPDALLSSASEEKKWDEEDTVIRNYKAFGVVSNPNLLGVRARTPHIVQCASLQVPRHGSPQPVPKFDGIDSGGDLESNDLKEVLGKRRRDGKHAPPQPLTKIQRVHIGRLVDKYGDDYQAMFWETKMNALQHSVKVLQRLCQRYHLTASNASRFKLRKMARSDGSAGALVPSSTGGLEEGKSC